MCALEEWAPVRVELCIYVMITGIVLAGGLSSRAKVNKLLLKVDSKPLISLTIDSIRPFVDEVVVVSGRYDEELRPHLKDVKVVYNKDYELGMFSSVLTGLREAKDEALLLPGDMANISNTTIKTILNNKGCISIPTYKGTRGHPLFLNKEMVNLVLKEDVNSNLRAFISNHEDKVNLVEVNDPFIEFDIDTIEDYNMFLAKRKELSYES